MIVFPSAKINLGLTVLNKREDGFHNLESVFLPVPIYDVLEFIESDSMSFESSVEIDDEKSNSILKAYELLKEKFELPPISIHLLKIIPIGAGLGGGSSNGAFMLTAINSYFKLGLTTKELENYAAEIGSDCPFFVENTPKLVNGRGEILTPISVILSGYKLVIINPRIHISTHQAFQHIIPSDLENTKLKETLLSEPISSWNKTVKNDFEASVFSQFPEIEKIKTTLYKNGALYSSMTGTGSSVFGIFDKEIDLAIFPESYFTISCNL